MEVVDVDLEDLRAALHAIGGRWKIVILACLVRGPLRFGALRRAVGGISEKVLAATLRELEAEGLVLRSAKDTVPPQVEYAMSPHARSLCDIVVALAGWGRHHRAVAGGGRPAGAVSGARSAASGPPRT